MPEVVEQTPEQIRQLLQERSHSSLYYHIEEVLGYKAMHPPLHRDKVCRFLSEWDDQRFIKLLLIPREHLKSTIASIGLPNWIWSVP